MEAGRRLVRPGLGLTLIRSFMDTVEVRAEETGTTVVMERRIELTLDV